MKVCVGVRLFFFLVFFNLFILTVCAPIVNTWAGLDWVQLGRVFVSRTPLVLARLGSSDLSLLSPAGLDGDGQRETAGQALRICVLVFVRLCTHAHSWMRARTCASACHGLSVPYPCEAESTLWLCLCLSQTDFKEAHMWRSALTEMGLNVIIAISTTL